MIAFLWTIHNPRPHIRYIQLPIRVHCRLTARGPERPSRRHNVPHRHSHPPPEPHRGESPVRDMERA